MQKQRLYNLLGFLLLTLLSASGQLKSGDLIFVAEREGAFSKAISASTAMKDSLKFVHVGIVEIVDQEPYVIEASPEEGVREVSLMQFLNESKNGYLVKRLSIDFPIEQTIQRAKSHLGENYDWWYLPDNGKMYCSELVYESYLTPDGKRIFKSSPMNFRDGNGEMPQFWVELFERIGSEVPEGLPGTNPNDLSKDELLIDIE